LLLFWRNTAMLNTFLPSSSSGPTSLIPNLPRRRGGQPSNRNAFKHGLYAVRNALPLTRRQIRLRTLIQDWKLFRKFWKGPSRSCANRLPGSLSLRRKVPISDPFWLGTDP
jgi:hypothetical protein